MPREPDAAGWVKKARETISEPERVTKAEVGVAVNHTETAFEDLGSNPAPEEYDTLVTELGRSDTDVERCRKLLTVIQERVEAASSPNE